MRWRGRRAPDVPLASGERALAWASSVQGDVAVGTRDAVYLPHGGTHVRLPWEQVEAADWDDDESRLRISEVGEWGAPRVEHVLVVDEPGRLLELVRERVTASIVLQRHVPVRGARGLRVVARRAPGRTGDIAWFYEYDEGVEPDEPAVRLAAVEALVAAREEVGTL